MNRLVIQALLAASLMLSSVLIFADEARPPRRIGVLLVAHSRESEVAQAFRQGLRDAGYVEGRDVVIEWRFPNGDYAQVPELVGELIRHKVDVMVVDGTVGTR